MTDNLLDFSASLDRHELLAGQPKSELSCQVNISPSAMTGDGSELATAASICLVFDCSASMIGNKFDTAVKTAKMIVDMLHERHWISLIAFQSDSYTVFENAVPTAGEKDFLKQQIDKLDSYLGGGTNMAAAIESGMVVLSESTADANVMVILSDGEPLFAERAQMSADVASKMGIQLYAVGIGRSYNADQLLRLVTPSNGAVFGASEVDKIEKIFYDLINRIDRIFATNVELDFRFDERVQLKQVFKTSPERALYDSSTINSKNKNNLELRVGNIENNKHYEFLLQIEVDRLDVGAIELIKARLQYDINHLGINMHVEEVNLTVNATESDSPQAGTNEKTVDAIRSASMVQLCDDLAQACAQADNDRALQTIDELQQRCDDENNTALRHHLDNMKSQLVSGGKISDKDRNDFLLASTIAPASAEPPDSLLDSTIAPPDTEPSDLLLDSSISPTSAEPSEFLLDSTIAPPDAEPSDSLLAGTIAPPKVLIYDLILVDPGLEIIRLLREIRDATNMGLREISDIIQCRNSVITVFKDKTSAEELQQRLAKFGANVKVDAREVVEADS
jgi:Mg-chelatase subunit ChlD